MNAHVAKKRRRVPKPAHLAAISVVLDPRTEALNAARAKVKNKKSSAVAAPATPAVAVRDQKNCAMGDGGVDFERVRRLRHERRRLLAVG